MNSDPINMIHTNQQSTKEGLKKNLKDILDQENQSIEANKFEHPYGTLATTFHKPVGEGNLYIRFLYIPQTIF